MGIFGRKKNLDIELKQDIAGYLVFPFQLKGDLVLLNHKAIVPQNCLLAFATRGRVLDYLNTGDFDEFESMLFAYGLASDIFF